ncbi:hypothetical protein BDV27DRAFT_164624 [Aspergillus caelatus]|uniref:Uncharacterized protein n=2 Tax=Aspergillus subgen. Circumdati TaxID=2720871 RepID=A0A5N6ZI33_9EURO|nr:uncharacterized protein BDV27DRAFT_164624 [Aspergillus caelatus]KAE8357314.1 hypothetical protein BDV27DRAFT_164624 [Aspergillus caelatus]KAE8413084.1 hypothetical protein BDV36DRAFT_300283 [Aspergillus pseudocaelatus]
MKKKEGQHVPKVLKKPENVFSGTDPLASKVLVHCDRTSTQVGHRNLSALPPWTLPLTFIFLLLGLQYLLGLSSHRFPGNNERVTVTPRYASFFIIQCER